MKIIFVLLVSFLLIQSCGKKSDPKYQGKINVEISIIS